MAFEAYSVWINSTYGGITELSKRYDVSRQFLYNLIYTLQIAMIISFSVNEEKQRLDKRKAIETILSLRFEGRCSIGAISTLMKRLGFSSHYSEGYISETIKGVGQLLSEAQYIDSEENLSIRAGADEIFAKSKPILITGDPKSSAILGITLSKDRTADSWSRHFESILETNPQLEINGMVTDEGKGLSLAIEQTFPFITRQPDTYHGIAHHFGPLRNIFEKKVYAAIEKEQKRDEVCMNRKTDRVFDEKYELYDKASDETIRVLNEYEDFIYLYACITNELQSFHGDGQIRDRSRAKEEIMVALELIEEMDNSNLNKEVQGIRKLFPELLNYFEQAKESVQKYRYIGLSNEISEVLQASWQWNKNFIKAKDIHRKNRAKEERDFYLEYAEDTLGEEFERIKELVYSELDNIIQASSIIENINSILRPYLDASRNQTTQEFLNIFAFYHNHRRYKYGKRKSQTPMEILTSQKQDRDWMELLFERIEQMEPDFFL